jgi:hypothetical protein
MPEQTDKELLADTMRKYPTWWQAVVGERKRADRLLTIAVGLFVMVPDQVWKDSLGDDGQGHYEGLYRAAEIQRELKSYGG